LPLADAGQAARSLTCKINSYDQARNGYFNQGQLTSAVRTAGGKTFTQSYDYDAAGRLARRTDIGVNGADYTGNPPVLGGGAA
jgi:YD repeat-containing protein